MYYILYIFQFQCLSVSLTHLIKYVTQYHLAEVIKDVRVLYYLSSLWILGLILALGAAWWCCCHVHHSHTMFRAHYLATIYTTTENHSRYHWTCRLIKCFPCTNFHRFDKVCNCGNTTIIKGNLRWKLQFAQINVNFVQHTQ